jgi:hypothetical protein
MNGNYDKQNNEEDIKEIEKENNKLNEFIKVKCMSYEDIWEIKKNLLFEFCELHKRVPKSREEYKNINIGNWFYSCRVSKKYYETLSKNIIVNNAIDKYFENQEKNRQN